MKEKTLLRLALASSAIGLAVMFLIYGSLSLDPMTLSEAKDEEIGTTIKIAGEVVSSSGNTKTMFLKVSQPTIETIDIFLFKDHDFDLREGQYVELTGEITEYKGKKEIVAHQLKVI